MPDVQVVNADAKLIERAIPKLKKRSKDGKVRDVRIVSLHGRYARFDVDLDKHEIMPQRVYLDKFINRNNSNEARGWTETLTMSRSVTITRSVTFTKSMTSSVSVTVSGNVTFPGGTGGSSSATYSRSVTTTDSKTFTESETITTGNTRTINTQVAAHSILEIYLRRTVGSVRVPFTGDAVLDGVIEAVVKAEFQVVGGIIAVGPQRKRFALADLLSEDDRRFEVAGFVQDSEATGLEIEYRESPIQGVALANKTIVDANDAAEDEVALGDLGPGQRAAAEDLPLDVGQAIEEFSGSTYIQTDNSIATIEVRHLSMGPGFCNVHTQSSLGGWITTNAPPAIWSDWQVVDRHMGPVATTLTTIINCDTGVRSQVRYYRR